MRFAETREVPLEEILVVPSWNVRGPIDPQSPGLADLAEHIEAEGQSTPLFVAALGSVPREWCLAAIGFSSKAYLGRWFLVSGFRRALALGKRNARTALVREVLDFEPADLRLLNLSENTDRWDLSLYQIATRVEELAKTRKVKEIARHIVRPDGTTYSEKSVWALLRIKSKCIPEILEGWKAGAPWSSKRNLEIAATHGTETKRGRDAQRALLVEWTGADAPDEVEDGTAPAKPRKARKAPLRRPAPARVTAVIAGTRQLAREATGKERAVLEAAVTALAWSQGCRPDGKQLGKRMRLEIAGHLLNGGG